MVAERKSCVALIAVTAVEVYRPTGKDRSALAAQVAEHRRVDHVRRTEQHFTLRCAGFITLVRGKGVTELLINAREIPDRSVQHQGQAGLTETAEQFLAFAQRIAEEH